MKYMGSKRAMLKNGLGEALDDAMEGTNRVLDLFTGSAAVAWHVAQRYRVAVVAADLQLYSSVLASSVIKRTSAMSKADWIDDWFVRAFSRLKNTPLFDSAQNLQSELHQLPVGLVADKARAISTNATDWPISLRYGGYYLSPWQSLWLDALRKTLPMECEYGHIALASLIQTASRASASPGHTAQPFKANDTAGRFLIEAWRRNVVSMVKSSALDIGARHALKPGEADRKSVV